MENQENQESQEFSAKTVDEAIKLALEKLDVKKEELEITVLKKGKSGILGLGAEVARISVKKIPPPPQEEISQAAQEILSKLLEAMGVSATVQLVESPPSGLATDSRMVSLDIKGADLGVLIGRRGQTLMSLQYILNLMVGHKTKSRVPVMVDVESYKRRRYETLQSLALRLAEQVNNSKQAVTLEPMPANERRIIHLALSNQTDVVTQSIGAGEARKVVIMPRGKETRPRYSRPPAEPKPQTGTKEE